MNLRVAVHATAPLPHVDDVFATGQIGHLGQGLTGCQRINAALTTQGTNITGHMRRVALLAQHGSACLEHAGYGAAVCVVAGAAIFRDRVVLLHKGAAFFSVTGVAGVVDTVALDQLGTG